jgi:acyl transferase domain-containing protein
VSDPRLAVLHIFSRCPSVGRELFRTCKVFRRSILECDGVYERMTGHSLIRQYGLFDETITPSHVLGDAWPIAVTLPSLTIIQVALFDTLAHLGLKPDIVVGHSAGETAVLYASGAASKKMVVELSIARGRGMAPLEDLDCSMAAISCSPAEAEEIIAQAVSEIGTGSLEIGCYNSADALTLSGANPELSRAVEIATGKGIFARRLKTRVAVHSSMMEHCRDTYCSAVQDVFARHKLVTPSTMVYSAATGEVMEVAGDADYFWSNTRGPVRFEQAIRAMTKAHPNTTFIEMGPHPVLASYLSSLAGSETIVTCPLRRLNPKKSEKDFELRAFLVVLGQMAVAHHHVDYSVLAGPEAKPLRRLPAYPFQKKSVPITYPTQDLRRFTRPRNGPLNFPELHVNSATHPSLADHIIKSTPIMPAAGYIEMVSP